MDPQAKEESDDRRLIAVKETLYPLSSPSTRRRWLPNALEISGGLREAVAPRFAASNRGKVSVAGCDVRSEEIKRVSCDALGRSTTISRSRAAQPLPTQRSRARQ